MKRRIFIAVNLPEYIKKELYGYKNKWPELPCRWTKKDNLHITLAFLGYLLDDELLEICGITRKIAGQHNPFSVKLNNIIYGPPGKNPPRMVWTEGERSREFSNLKNDLEKTIVRTPDSLGTLSSSRINSEMAGFVSEKRIFSPHITLARIRTWEFRRMESEEEPEIDEEINLNFEVSSIEVMESQLKKGGPEYIILESCQLKN